MRSYIVELMINRDNGNPLVTEPKNIRTTKNENLEEVKTAASVRIVMTRDTISRSFVENNFPTSPLMALPCHDHHPRARLIGGAPEKRR